MISPKPDSIYQNLEKLKPGIVVATEEGECLALEKPTFTGWSTINIHTKERRDLELVKDMTGMRYVGRLHSQTKEGIYVVNDDDQIIFVEKGAYNKKIFFTAQANYHEESVFVVNIPKSRYDEPACVEAKQKELRDYKNLDVFDVVDIDEATNDIIATKWILIEKEKQDGTKVIKARLCLMGNMKESLHKICNEVPTVNNKSLKILLSIAVSQGWEIRTCDVERAFLQSDQNQHGVLVKPPVELNLPRDKALKLNKIAYGLVDASRAFYLKQVEELKSNDFQPLKMDPALFVHKTKGKTMCDAATAIHVNDLLVAGKKDIIKSAQQKIKEDLRSGVMEDLPARFLGLNYR